MILPSTSLLLLLALGAEAAPAEATIDAPAARQPEPSKGRVPATPTPIPPKSGPVLCDIPKSSGEGFYIVASPSTRCPKSIRVNEPVYAILECTPRAGYATCNAWPEVYPVNPGDEFRLSYEWTVRVGWNTQHYPPSHTPVLSFACPGIETVSVTVRVSNGSASDLDITGFRCGDDPR